MATVTVLPETVPVIVRSAGSVELEDVGLLPPHPVSAAAAAASDTA